MLYHSDDMQNISKIGSFQWVITDHINVIENELSQIYSSIEWILPYSGSDR